MAKKEDKYYSIVRERFESDEANRFFPHGKLVRLLDDHRAGKADNSRKIWTLYMFLVWYQIYFRRLAAHKRWIKEG